MFAVFLFMLLVTFVMLFVYLLIAFCCVLHLAYFGRGYFAIVVATFGLFVYCVFWVTLLLDGVVLRLGFDLLSCCLIVDCFVVC